MTRVFLWLLPLCLLGACGAAPAPMPPSEPLPTELLSSPTPIPSAEPSPTPDPTNVMALPSPEGVTLHQAPDLRGLSPEEASKLLSSQSLALGEARASCQELGAEPTDQPTEAGRIICQSIAPASLIPPELPIDYVLAGDTQ